MKLIIVLLTTALSANSFGASQKTVRVKNAHFKLCPRTSDGRPLAAGCTDSIQLNKKKSIHFDFNTVLSSKIYSCFERVIGSFRFHEFSETPDFEVTGYITKEKGLFPNPSVEFDVFHILDSADICSLPLPRGLNSDNYASKASDNDITYTMYCGSKPEIKALAIAEGKTFTDAELDELGESRKPILDILLNGDVAIQSLLDSGSKSDTGPFGAIIACSVIDSIKNKILKNGCRDWKTNKIIKNISGIAACDDFLKRIKK